MTYSQSNLDSAIVSARVCTLPAHIGYAILDPLFDVVQLRALLNCTPEILAAIQIHSPDLYAATNAWLAGTGDCSEKLRSKLHSVVVRMATRATPFGAYSGVTLLCGESSTILSCDSTLRLHARPDSGWLHSLIDDMEKNPDILRKLRLFLNDCVVVRGEYLHILNFRQVITLGDHGSQRSDYGETSLRYTAAVKFCIDKVTQGTTWEALCSEIASAFGLPPVRANDFVLRLRDAGLLFTELEHDPLGDTWQRFRGAIANIDTPSSPQLASIAREFEDLRKRDLLNWDFSKFDDLRNRMSDLARADHYIQVDATKGVSGSLPACVLQDVLETADLLLRAGSQAELSTYRNRFIEIFEGTTRAVPLLDLIDEDWGIGAPSQESFSEVDSDRNAQLLTLLTAAIKTGSDEVLLSDHDLPAIFPALVHESEMPDSIDVGFEVRSNSADDVYSGKYTIWPVESLMTNSQFALLGRFMWALSDADRGMVRAIINRSLDDDVIDAELSYNLSNRRMANVTSRPCLYPYYIALGHDHIGDEYRLSLTDLVVSMDPHGQRFMLYSLSHRKPVRLHVTHVLNRHADTPLIQFLRALDNQGKRVLSGFDWGSLTESPFLPRLQYKNLILSTMKWHVRAAQWKSGHKNIAEAIIAWKERWRVPDVVVLCDHDRKLTINLSTAAAVRTLTALIDGGAKCVHFEESRPLEQIWLTDSKGNRCHAEYILHAKLSKKHELKKATKPAFVVASTGHAEPWVCAHYACGSSRAERVLTQCLPGFLNELRSDGLLDKWFFVRYVKTQRHLRIRFKAIGGSTETLRSRVVAFSSMLRRAELISSVAFEEYKPEFERYGGPITLAHMEDLFDRDSNAAIDLMGRSAPLSRLRLFHAVLSAHQFVESFIGDNDPRLWLGLGSVHKKMTTAERDLIREISEAIGQGQPIGDKSDIGDITTAISMLWRDSATGEEKLKSLLESFLHLHYNRFGILNGGPETTAHAIQRSVYLGLWARKNGAASAVV